MLAITSVIALSVTLVGCSSQSQTSSIKAACDLAIAKDYDGTRNEFMEIARNNPGYIDAAAGARIWAMEKGAVMPEFNTFLAENVYTNMYGVKPNAFAIVYHNLQSFYTLCGFELQK